MIRNKFSLFVWFYWCNTVNVTSTSTSLPFVLEQQLQQFQQQHQQQQYCWNGRQVVNRVTQQRLNIVAKAATLSLSSLSLFRRNFIFLQKRSSRSSSSSVIPTRNDFSCFLKLIDTKTRNICFSYTLQRLYQQQQYYSIFADRFFQTSMVTDTRNHVKPGTYCLSSTRSSITTRTSRNSILPKVLNSAVNNDDAGVSRMTCSMNDNDNPNNTSDDVIVLADWRSLDPESLSATKCLIEQTLCIPPMKTLYVGSDSKRNIQYFQPQLASGFHHANAILEAWKDDEQQQQQESLWMTEWKSVQYHVMEPCITCSQNQHEQPTKNIGSVPLFGHFVRKQKKQTLQTKSYNSLDDIIPHSTKSRTTSSNTTCIKKGIVLFHTAAGPHDLFLLWKAAALVNTLFCEHEGDDADVTVFIADLYSDDIGWGWCYNKDEDSTKKNFVMNRVFGNNNDSRQILRNRIQASVDVLCKEIQQQQQEQLQRTMDTSSMNYCTKLDDHHVTTGGQSYKLAALGWCLGGKAIMELSCMKVPRMTAMSTFHGVFYTRQQQQQQQQNGDFVITNNENNVTEYDTSLPIPWNDRSEVLICNGCDDSYVTNECLEYALETFQNNHNIVSLLQLQNAKHGFTNPAQVYNPNTITFGYHKPSADKSWKQTIALLRRRFVSIQKIQ